MAKTQKKGIVIFLFILKYDFQELFMRYKNVLEKQSFVSLCNDMKFYSTNDKKLT